MNIKNKVKLCGDTLDAALPPDFIQSVTGRLPEGVEEIYPDVVFVNDMEVYAAFKMRPSEPKGIKQCLKELYWVLSKKECGFSKIGIWEKEVHDIHMGKLCYSSCPEMLGGSTCLSHLKRSAGSIFLPGTVI